MMLDGMAETRTPNADALNRYLDSLPAAVEDGPFRCKAAFDPAEVPKLWRNMILVEEWRPSLFLIRFVGSEIVSWHGRELVNRVVVEEEFGDAARHFLALYREVQRRPQGLTVTGTLAWQDRPWVSFRQSMWPLLCPERHPKFIIGTIDFYLNDPSRGRLAA